MNNFIINNIGKLFISFACFIFLFASYILYQDYKRPTFELKKDDWKCTEEQTVLVPVTTMVGKTTIMTTQVHFICVNYHRIN